MNVRSRPVALLLLAAVACSGERERDGGNPSQPEQFVVGPSGAVFTSLDGVQIEVPAGALSSTITMTLSKTTLPAGNDLTPVSTVFEFKPSGTEFAVPVTLRIPYIGAGTQPLGFYYTGEDAPTILSAVANAQIANGVGTAQVSHFSIGCVAYPNTTSARDAGVTESADGGEPERDGGLAPRDGGPAPDSGPGGCGCSDQGAKCEACCEIQSVCGYTECVSMECGS